MNKRMPLRLHCGSVFSGGILEPFCDQGTWYGKFRPVIQSEPGGTQRRLLEFITFCEEWNERPRSSYAPDASEFEAFRDLTGPGL